MNIKNVNNLKTMLQYFGENLLWGIDSEDVEDYGIDCCAYEIYPEDLGIKDEEFVKIKFLYQIQPMTDNMPFGIFAITFESKRLEVSALKKILSKLVVTNKNLKNNPTFKHWNKDDLIFLLCWGENDAKYIGVAHFDDNDKNFPQIKVEYCEVGKDTSYFENKLSNLEMPSNTNDLKSWKEQWKKTFSAFYKEQINDSKKLAKELAQLTQHTKENIINSYRVETSLGYVHLLYDKFKKNLVHDLTPEQFADMYAQTISYGLFSAKCMSKSEQFEWKNAINDIPTTNPFLKELLKGCFEDSSQNKTVFFDELELAEIIKLLDMTNINNILEHFNRQTGGGREDTVIYFYEDFLSEYEKDTKKQRGVYYTPYPVVQFMVRAVNDILKTEFGIKDGLADNSKQPIKRIIGKKKVSFEEHSIQILDPATGTGTFLREIILQIYETFKQNNSSKSSSELKSLWNEYVDNDLLPRLNGFELMMAPYAVAHMKLAMVLKDTGYEFKSNNRLRVMLTNTLEPPKSSGRFEDNYDDGYQLDLLEKDILALESHEADKTKNNNLINVIIGNPPYSGISANNNEYIAKLINDYKYIDGEYFNERKHWLNDDYVKFIRHCENIIEKNGSGILAFINNNGFLANPTFRCMRYHLLKTFDKIYIINLHGDANKREQNIDGSKDENVFNIMQGVSINIFIKNSNKNNNLADIYYTDIFGKRESKYNILCNNTIQYTLITSCKPYYLFIPSNFGNSKIYDNGFNINELFPINTSGLVTARDSLVINKDKNKLLEQISRFVNFNYSDDEIRKIFFSSKKSGKYLPGDSRGWNLSKARHLIKNNNHYDYIQTISYRPFDNQYIYYCNDIIDWPRTNVMCNFINKNNIGLIIARSNKGSDCSHFYISKNMPETKLGARTNPSNVFPLFIYNKNLESTTRTPNLDMEIVKQIENKLNLKFNPNSDGGTTETFAPIDLLDYIYAVLHSPKYRDTYKEFLKIDFPRVPYPTDIDMFWKLVELGSKLRKIHLMESPSLDNLITKFEGVGSNIVEKPSYKDNRVYINKQQYFDGVPELAWNFYIGGYQPLQKWLKDRKNETLSNDDIIHYQKIVVALIETDKLMHQIDEIFEF